jgi:hypothetical protein
MIYTDRTSAHRRSNQRGSALLIVFVFAAMVAIMLYREMPVAAFEAQRQKEQLLINRGNEYKRAVKLYVRKFQTFPSSMQALENTNRMRFLRNRYVDPYTGKDDWRLLHAGPGGIILDSKIKQSQLGPRGAPGSVGSPVSPTAGTTSSFGSSVGFGTGSANAGALPANGPNGQPAAANAFPFRPPAIMASSAGSDNGAPQDPQSTDGQASSIPYPGFPGQTGSATDSGSGQAGGPFPIPGAGRFRNGNQPGDAALSTQADGSAQDPQVMLQSLLNNQNPQQPTQQQPSAFNSTGNNGTVATSSGAPTAFGANAQNNNNTNMGGGIAGVASKSIGHTIKIINDQTNRSLWEFVYDMQKELTANAPGLANANGTGSNGASNGPQGAQGNTSSFNSPNQNSTFGNSFGTSPTPTPTPAPAPPTSNQ